MASAAVTPFSQPAARCSQGARFGRLRAEQHLQNAAVVFLFLYALAQPVSIAATHVFYAGAAAAWLLRVGLTRGRCLRPGPLDWPILMYLALAAVATLHSPFPAASWEGMRKVLLVCAVLVFAHNVGSLERARQIVHTLLLAVLVSAGWTFWLYAHGVGLRVARENTASAWFRDGVRPGDIILAVDGRRLTSPRQFGQYLREKPAAEPLRLSAVPAEGIEVTRNAKAEVLPPGDWAAGLQDSASAGLVLETARPARAFGFYAHYVTYSMVLALAASLVFGFWLGGGERFSAQGLLTGAVFCALALALGLTLTRAAWLALALACAVQVWFHWRRWSVRVLLPVALAATVLVTDAAMHRWRGTGLVDFRDPGTDFRILMWKDGLRLIGQHPWSGVGLNAVRDYWPLFDLAAYRKYALRSHFHSTPIQIAVELGIPALAAWMVLMAAYWRMLAELAARAREKDGWSYGFALGTLGATSGFLASSLVHYDFGDSNVVFLFWLLAGIALAVREQLAPRAIP